eukprot:910771_1
MSEHEHEQQVEVNKIEEEPAHELYANLVGLSSASFAVAGPTTTATKSQTCKYDDDKLNPSSGQISYSNTSNTGSYIIPDVPVREANPPMTSTSAPQSQFGKFYQNALSNPAHLSKLSLDKSNRGFQLLTKMRWREHEGGLGRNRQGTLMPVKTCLKHDMKGIGSRSKSGKKIHAKVTHVLHKADKNDVEKGQQNVSRSEKRRIAIREKHQEDQLESKRARMMINSDLPEEYYKYL